MTEPVDVEYEEIARYGETLPAVREVGVANLFGAADPVAVIEQAERVASAVAAVIEAKGLFKQIGPKKHVLVEGWTLLGSMLGVFPVTEWTRPIKDSHGKDGWEARVVAVTRAGETVGTRESMCSRSETRWAKADDYAIRSMAQTRAVSGALSSPLRFIMELAGYAGTPEAEMHTAGIPDVRQDAPSTPVPKSWAELQLAFANLSVDEVWLEQAAEVAKKLGGPFQRFQSAYLRLLEHDPWPGLDSLSPPRSVLREVFASVLDGEVLEGPVWRIGWDETAESCPDRPAPPGADVEVLADETIMGPPA